MFQKQAIKIRKQSNNRGYTLLEVLIALTIFAVGILAVAAMQISSIQGNTTAREVTTATTWAADRLDKLMALPYDNTALDAGAHQDTQGKYTIGWNVANTDIDGDGSTDFKTITVTVNWANRGTGRTVSMQHIVTDINM